MTPALALASAPEAWQIATAGACGLVAGRYLRRSGPAPGTGYPDPASQAPRGALPAVGYELVTALLFAAIAWKIGWTPGLPAYLFFTAISVKLAMVDLRHRLLPNAIVLPGIAACLLLLAIAAAAGSRWDLVLRGILGGLILFTAYLILALISPRGMGMGDVKLAALVGLILAYRSWTVLFGGTLMGFLLGAVASVLVLASRRGNRKSSIPFGPFMLSGALIAIMLG